MTALGGRERGSGAIVVGASGFIGRHLSTSLSKQGIDVVGVSREQSREPYIFSKRLLDEKYTVFYAAGSVVPASAENEPWLARAEYEAFAKMLDWCERSRGCFTIVLLSSGGTVYAPTKRPPYSEKDPVEGLTEYSRLKLSMEKALHDMRDALPSIIIRLANVYGPFQQPRPGYGVIAHWLRAVANGRPLELYGDDGVRRDYIYLDDVVQAMINLHMQMKNLPSGLVLNLGLGKPVSLGELRRLISLVTGRDLTFLYKPARPFDLREVWLDTSLAKDILGWSPTVGLEEGLRRTWSAVKTF